jgi:asparagine synthetase A
MKFNEYYIPEKNSFSNQIVISFIDNFIIEKMQEDLDLLKVKVPLISDFDSELINNHDEKTRRINFDFGTKFNEGTFYLDHTN